MFLHIRKERRHRFEFEAMVVEAAQQSTRQEMLEALLYQQSVHAHRSDGSAPSTVSHLWQICEYRLTLDWVLAPEVAALPSLVEEVEEQHDLEAARVGHDRLIFEEVVRTLRPQSFDQPLEEMAPSEVLQQALRPGQEVQPEASRCNDTDHNLHLLRGDLEREVQAGVGDPLTGGSSAPLRKVAEEVRLLGPALGEHLEGSAHQ